MNVIKVMGGLGNQLFQYAFGKVMTLSGQQVGYDLHWFELTKSQFPPRPYRLHTFNTQVGAVLFEKKNPTVIDHRVGFNPDLFKLQNHNFDGYWQYFPYYTSIIPTLNQEFQVKSQFYTPEFLESANTILESESIAVHVRRGDYIKQTWGILPTAYYFEAIKQMPKGPIFIFSDDLPWCKDVFKQSYFSNKVVFVDMVDYLSFELMRLCKHIVMSSSTYSWWAAFLNQSGMVVAPPTWLGETGDPYKLHYPKHWKIC